MDTVLSDIRQEFRVITLRFTELELHLQMIDKNIERLVQLCRLINGQLPTDPYPDGDPVR